METDEIKARLAGQWATAIAALCRIDPAALDGKKHPCPKCGGDDRFRFIDEKDGACLCNQCFKEKNGDGIAAIMWLNNWTFGRTKDELEEYISPRAEKIAEPVRKLRHQVYTKLASMFGLANHHHAALTERGLSAIEIEHRGYWSLVGSPTVQLMKEFTATDRTEISKHVPGVMPGGSLSIAASNCLMIPVRSIDGEVVGIQYRPDNRKPKESKYLWLSSTSRGLPAASVCHFAMPPADRECDSKIVRLTEGPLKADIATALSGTKTLAIAGVGSWKVGVDGIKSLAPEFVWLAFDGDAVSNAGVASAVVNTYDELLKSGVLVRMEVWPDEYKGIDDALAAGVATEVLTIEDTKKKIDRLRLVKKESGIAQLRNFKLVPSKSEDPKKVWDKEPLLVPQIADQLLKMTGGWPKCCDGQLFVETDAKEIRRFTDYNQLFGWVGSKVPVEFSGGEGCLTKKEVCSQLPFHVEQFEDTEEWPHFPARPGHYYSKHYEPGDGAYLEKFLDLFSPATEYDRELILAFIATTFWGGAPGRRVCFGIDSISGTGAGKSELVKRVASLTGGTYEFDAKDLKEEVIRKALVNGQKHRVALLDNVKDSVLSSSIIESLVTSAVVAGHKLHVGYTSRPNTITWAVTMNGMSLSRDLAQRTVLIKLTTPVRSGTWDDDVDRFIAEHREKIVADVAAFFKRPQATLHRFTRWSSWERAILARLKNPDALQTLIENRSNESDEDRKTAESINEYFSAQLAELGYDTEKEVIHIPSSIARQWLIDSSGKEHSQRSASSHIKQLIDGGSLRNFRQNPCRTNGRGWLWNGGHSEIPVNYTLEKTYFAKKMRESFFSRREKENEESEIDSE